ncbi:MAG: V-type ATP synthase subunit E, partial [Peptoniphilus rhinitidis]
MAGLENILNKITEDAEKKAEEIIKEAEDKKIKIIENREDDAKKLSDKLYEVSKKEREDILKRAKSGAELEARDKILSEKHKKIDEILELAIKELD